MRPFLTFCFSLATASLLAQPANRQEPLPKLDGFTTAFQSINASDLKAHLTFLASDELEGRETGTHGQRVAAKYIASQFMRLGLKPGNNGSYFQYFKVANVQIENTDLKIGREKFGYRKDYFATNLMSVPETLTGEWVFGGFGLQQEGYDNFKHFSAQDKNVLLLAGSPDKSVTDIRRQIGMWMKNSELIREKGAKSVWMVVPDEVYEKFSIMAKTSTFALIGDEAAGAPVFILNSRMGTALLKAGNKKMDYAKTKEMLEKSDALPSMNFAKLNLNYALKKKAEETLASNVMGLLEGTDKKDEIIVITAHYDHLGAQNGKVYNGADDDGSGTVTILELAEAYATAAKNGIYPRRSILFMTVSGEEKGLWGSEFYSDNPVYPIEKTVCNLNIDMIGRIDPAYQNKKDSANYVYLIGSDKLSSELDAINKEMNNKHTQLTLDYKYNDPNDPERFYYRSDHYNFARKGIPVIFYFTGVHKDYHQPTDDVEKINFDKMVTIGRLVFSTAWELANREKRIVVDSNKK